MTGRTRQHGLWQQGTRLWQRLDSSHLMAAHRRYSLAGGDALSSAVTYSLLLALLPTLLLLAAGTSAVARLLEPALGDDRAAALTEAGSGAAHDVLAAVPLGGTAGRELFDAASGPVTVFGTALAVYAALALFRAGRAAVRTLWGQPIGSGQPARRPGLRRPRRHRAGRRPSPGGDGRGRRGLRPPRAGPASVGHPDPADDGARGGRRRLPVLAPPAAGRAGARAGPLVSRRSRVRRAGRGHGRRHGLHRAGRRRPRRGLRGADRAGRRAGDRQRRDPARPACPGVAAGPLPSPAARGGPPPHPARPG